jgi:hypothetical protein
MNMNTMINGWLLILERFDLINNNHINWALRTTSCFLEFI